MRLAPTIGLQRLLGVALLRMLGLGVALLRMPSPPALLSRSTWASTTFFLLPQRRRIVSMPGVVSCVHGAVSISATLRVSARNPALIVHLSMAGLAPDPPLPQQRMATRYTWPFHSRHLYLLWCCFAFSFPLPTPLSCLIFFFTFILVLRILRLLRLLLLILVIRIRQDTTTADRSELELYPGPLVHAVLYLHGQDLPVALCEAIDDQRDPRKSLDVIQDFTGVKDFMWGARLYDIKE